MNTQDSNHASSDANVRSDAAAGSIRVGSIRGTVVRIHPAFVVAALATAGMCMGTASWHPVLFLPALLAAVAVHELAHAIVARRLGYRADSVVLHPLLNTELPADPEDRPWDVCRIALAGPAANLLVAIAAGAALPGRGAGHDPAATVTAALAGDGFLVRLFLLNALFAVLNFVPAYPADGGRALYAALSVRLNPAAALSASAILSQFVAGLLALAAFAQGNLLIGLIAVMISLATTREMRRHNVNRNLAGRTLRDVMIPRPQTVAPGASLGSVAAGFSKSRQRFFPVMCGDDVLGVLRREAVIQRIASDGEAAHAYVAAAMERRIETASPDELLEDMLSRQVLRSNRPVLVLDGGNLVGMVTRESIQERLVARPATAGGRLPEGGAALRGELRTAEHGRRG